MANSVHATFPNPFEVNLPKYAPGSWTRSLPQDQGKPERTQWYLGRAFIDDLWTDDDWNIATSSVMDRVETGITIASDCPCFVNPNERARLIEKHRQQSVRIYLAHRDPRTNLVRTGQGALEQWLNNAWRLLMERCLIDGVAVGMAHRRKGKNGEETIIRGGKSSHEHDLCVLETSFSDDAVQLHNFQWTNLAHEGWRDRIDDCLTNAYRPTDRFHWRGFTWWKDGA